MPQPHYEVQGGFKTAAIYSGQVAPGLNAAPGAVAVGSDVLLQSGGGRLWKVIIHQAVLTLSGVNMPIYDGAAAVSGGPLYTSGHILLSALGGPGGASGQFTASGEVNFQGGLPFNSGLIVNSRSGQPGATFVWSREDISKNY